MANRSAWRSLLVPDISGSVLPLVAVGILVSAAMVGGGIDMSRAYRVKNRLQVACDSATLAGRKAVTVSGYDANARQVANSYFNINFTEAQLDSRNVVFKSELRRQR